MPAEQVRLNGLGAKTHANWLLFRIPFGADQLDRVRGVKFQLQAKSTTSVGALLFGSVCIRFPAGRGGHWWWSIYTTSGIGRTQRYGWHPGPPTDDPTIVGVNVPTRVANYVACGWDEGHLDEPSDWDLSVNWEER